MLGDMGFESGRFFLCSSNFSTEVTHYLIIYIVYIPLMLIKYSIIKMYCIAGKIVVKSKY